MAKGLITTVAGASFSGSPAPDFVPMISGFPTANLVGLYLLQDGTLNAAMPSSIANAAPGGAAATRVAGNPAPIQRGYGIELNPAGAISLYETGLTLSPSFTIVAAGRYVAPSDTNSKFLALFRPKTTNNVGINIFAQNGSASDGQWGAFLAAPGAIRDGLAGSNGHNPGAVAFRFDGPTGTVTVRDHAGRSSVGVHSAAIDLFASSTDQWRVGFYGGSTAMQAEMYVAAVYNVAIPDGRMIDAVNAARNLMVARGLTPSS